MSVVILNHRVKDFADWKPRYDADLPRRSEAGLKELYVGTKEDDPQEVYLIFEVKDVARAQKMLENPELHKVMDESGVIRRPSVTVLKTL